MQIQKPLNKTLEEIDIDSSFKVKAKRMELHTLQDVMDKDLNVLKGHAEFTMTWYMQLLSILKNEKLIDDFQKKLYG